MLRDREELAARMEARELILVGTSDLNDMRMLAALLSGNDYDVTTAGDAMLVRDQVRTKQPDLVLLDCAIAGGDAADICRQMKANQDSVGIPVIGLVPMMDSTARQVLLKAGIDDIVGRPFFSDEILMRLRVALGRRRISVEADNLEKLLFSVVSAFESREEAKKGHPERVARMSRRLGERMNLNRADQDALYKGGILHDIGMIKVPKHVVDKPGALSSEEFELMKLHTIWGERMCRPVHSLQRVLPMIRHHHEQMDGKGYPDGLVGEQIPLLARILAVGEVFDALSSDRPYRPRMPRPEAVRYLREYSQRKWLDADIVEGFLQMVEEEGWPEVPALEHEVMNVEGTRGGGGIRDQKASSSS